MTTRTQNHTGRTIALIGGGALLAWLLWRGRGKGSGGTGKGSGGPNRALAAVEVQVRNNDRIELDGVSSDLPTVIAHARAAGAARVHIAGDARQGWADNVIRALQAAGVDVRSTS